MHIMQCFPCAIRCPRAQCNGGKAKPNWARIENKRAKQESREPDLRWGPDAAQPPVDLPTIEPQQHQNPSEDHLPLCAATAMMHGIRIPSGAASSWQGAVCPSIHEHRQWARPARENDVILPNPGYRVDANIWHLDIRERALRPGPIASLLRHCNTMESPPNPSYLQGGPQPADDIRDLRRDASMENLIELQRYAERLQFEATCLRLWSNRIQDQIMDETQKVHAYMTRMTGELNRLRHIQPAWLQQWQAKAPTSTAIIPPPSSTFTGTSSSSIFERSSRHSSQSSPSVQQSKHDESSKECTVSKHSISRSVGTAQA